MRLPLTQFFFTFQGNTLRSMGGQLQLFLQKASSGWQGSPPFTQLPSNVVSSYMIDFFSLFKATHWGPWEANSSRVPQKASSSWQEFLPPSLDCWQLHTHSGIPPAVPTNKTFPSGKFQLKYVLVYLDISVAFLIKTLGQRKGSFEIVLSLDKKTA